MKKSAITALVAIGLAEISAAMPARAQGVETFVGPYIGGHAGTFNTDTTFTSLPYTGGNVLGLGAIAFPGRNDIFDLDTNLAGVHGGVNFLLGPNLIGGVEADWSNLGSDDTASGSGTGFSNDGFAYQYRSQVDLNWQATIRGRLGVVAGNTLFFATAGVALLDADWSEQATLTNTAQNLSSTLNHSAGETLIGSVIGGGFEVAILPVIMFGADYLYEQFGSFGTVSHGTQTGETGMLGDMDVHKVRVRVSVKFGGPPQ